MVARHISQHLVDPTGLDAFTACRLEVLDKCPGIRPVGIGEVVRRMGALQVCAGQCGGCEAAVHAMRHIFCIVLVDWLLPLQ